MLVVELPSSAFLKSPTQCSESPPCSVPYRLCRISDNVKTSDQGERVERALIDLEGESPIEVVVSGITRKIF